MSEHNDRYGHRHRRMRAAVKRDVEAGRARCSRCRLPIHPSELWDLDHVDGGGPREYRGPSHRRCNRQTVTHLKEPAQEIRPWSVCWAPGTPNARCLECRESGVWRCAGEGTAA